MEKVAVRVLGSKKNARTELRAVCADVVWVRGLVALLLAAMPATAVADSTPPGIPVHHCIADPNGKIDFEGRLGSAGGLSQIRIFTETDASDFYLNNLQAQFGSGAQPTPAITTIDDAQKLLAVAQQIPGMLASAPLAQIVDGAFKCTGFAPGRYSFLAEIYGNGARVGDPPLGMTFYRADIDVSSLNHRATVVVRGFRRIGTNPPHL